MACAREDVEERLTAIAESRVVKNRSHTIVFSCTQMSPFFTLDNKSLF